MSNRHDRQSRASTDIDANQRQRHFNGGRFVIAMPRGSGKTTISELAAVWVALYGHKRFILFVGASQPKANDNLDSIKGILESDALLEDFPEICYPIRALDSISQRANGQIYHGKATHIEWGSTVVVLPMLSGVKSAGAGTVIMTAGITSKSIRGSKHRRGDGVQLRPDFAVLDDCQDDDSARSPVQVEKRLKVIQKAILRSAGHMSDPESGLTLLRRRGGCICKYRYRRVALMGTEALGQR